MKELICPIAYNAKYSPKSPAIFIGEEILSYGDLSKLVEGMCETLEQMNLGSRVPYLAYLQKETIVLLFALFRLGKIACPINPKLPLEGQQQALDKLDTALLLDPQKLVLQAKEPKSLSYFAGLECATLLFTSGSSGSPKIASLSFWNHFANALSTFGPLHIEPDSRWHLSLPLYHVGGLAILFRCFLSGAAVDLSPALSSQLTHVSFVPTQLYRLLKDPKLTKELAKSLKCILLGGAPIAQGLYAQAMQAGLQVFPTYGMTEMGSLITVDITPEKELLTCGEKLALREVQISSDGEILVRGETLFQGYWDKETGLCLPLKNGYFATNDLGKFTQDGKLIYCGRQDNLFISGGENIQPEEIEGHLLTIDGIMEAIVVPTFDAEFGSRPTAFIRTDGRWYSLEEIREILGAKLPKYKLPIAVEKLNDDGSLKVNRAKLKEQTKI